jgi:hypothetical protein
VETLRTIDAAATTAINLVGNTLDNIVTGNAGVNSLSGGDGNDTVTGNAGNGRHEWGRWKRHPRWRAW